jgi:hypothetical protein
MIACAFAGEAAGQRTLLKSASKAMTAAVPSITSSIAVRLVALPDGVALNGTAGGTWDLDLGKFSYAAAPAKPNISARRLSSSLVVSTEFGVEIVNGSISGGTATLLALLQSVLARYSVRIDGILLESSALPVAPHLRMGTVSRHRLEIEIPVNLTEKDAHLSNAIQFSVVQD